MVTWRCCHPIAYGLAPFLVLEVTYKLILLIRKLL